jgi:hypothetical protein
MRIFGCDLGYLARTRAAWRYPGVGDDHRECTGAIGYDRWRVAASLTGLEEEYGPRLSAMRGVRVLRLHNYNNKMMRRRWCETSWAMLPQLWECGQCAMIQTKPDLSGWRWRRPWVSFTSLEASARCVNITLVRLELVTLLRGPRHRISLGSIVLEYTACRSFVAFLQCSLHSKDDL